jgi:pimeloyl-ACP methyl ester carboxylesterase
VSLAYERRGEGPELVLLHGLGHRRQAWDVVLPLVTPHRTVITVDLPGHGESPDFDAKGQDPVEAMGAELMGLLEELKLDRPHIAGNSLGGALALGAAARGHARTAIGLSPAGFWAASWQYPYTRTVFKSMLAAGERLGPRVPRLASSTLGRTVLNGAIMAKPSRITPTQAEGDAISFFRAKDAINQVLDQRLDFTEAANIPSDVRVTIAWGAQDRLLQRSQGHVAKKYLPNARFILMPGCGHVPMTDNPEMVANVLLQGSREPA